MGKWLYFVRAVWREAHFLLPNLPLQCAKARLTTTSRSKVTKIKSKDQKRNVKFLILRHRDNEKTDRSDSDSNHIYISSQIILYSKIRYYSKYTLNIGENICVRVNSYIYLYYSRNKYNIICKQKNYTKTFFATRLK